MNIRCFYCQTPFTLGRAELLAALQHMAAENLNHYDAHCPRCRRANSVARQRMEMVFPNWRQAAQEQAAPAPAPEKVESPASKKPVAAAEKKPAAAPSKSKTKAKPAAAKAKPAAKPAAKTRKK